MSCGLKSGGLMSGGLKSYDSTTFNGDRLNVVSRHLEIRLEHLAKRLLSVGPRFLGTLLYAVNSEIIPPGLVIQVVYVSSILLKSVVSFCRDRWSYISLSFSVLLLSLISCSSIWENGTLAFSSVNSRVMTLTKESILQCRIKVARGPWHILSAGPLHRRLATFATSTGARNRGGGAKR